MSPLDKPIAVSEWTPQGAAAYASALSPTSRRILAEALAAAEQQDDLRLLLAQIGAELGADLTATAAVYFASWDYEGLFYLNETGTIYYSDGRPPKQTDLSITVNELMTTVYGRVGADTGLLIDPASGRATLWETGAEQAIAVWLTETADSRHS